MARCVWLNELSLEPTVISSAGKFYLIQIKFISPQGLPRLLFCTNSSVAYKQKKHWHISVPMLDMKEFRGKLVISLD